MKEISRDEINGLDMFSFQERVIKEIVKKDDEHTKQVIKDYLRERYPKENIRIDFLDEEIVNQVLVQNIKKDKL